MKCKLILPLLFVLMLTMTACGAAEDVFQPASPTAVPTGSERGERILIAYFSVPETDGVDTVSSASRVAVGGGEVVGNTQFVANIIEEVTGGTLWRIETVTPYPGPHEPLLAYAHEEAQNYAHPELTGSIENLNDYDVIFLGYPNWNADLPMPLYAFLGSYDLSGKTIIPFNTHGGSRLSGTVQTIAELQPASEVVTDAFTVYRNDVPACREDVIAWLRGLGYQAVETP